MANASMASFWSRVDSSGDCWLWTSHLGHNGYGRTGWAGGTKPAHVIAKAMLSGFPTDGRQHDHLCRTRACVNPTHLERVDTRTNLLRGETHAAANAAKTHCLRGHPLSGDNVYIRRDRPRTRNCRACIALRSQRFKEVQ
jgi:hypothetical protein